MKLPRWLMIAMLTSSVLAPLGAAGWWWVTWPERTAREFVRLLEIGSFDDAKQFVGGNYSLESLDKYRGADGSYTLDSNSRTFRDLAAGRQDFTINGPVDFRDFAFQVSRGKVGFAHYVPWELLTQRPRMN